MSMTQFSLAKSKHKNTDYKTTKQPISYKQNDKHCLKTDLGNKNNDSVFNMDGECDASQTKKHDETETIYANKTKLANQFKWLPAELVTWQNLGTFIDLQTEGMV